MKLFGRAWLGSRVLSRPKLDQKYVRLNPGRSKTGMTDAWDWGHVVGTAPCGTPRSHPLFVQLALASGIYYGGQEWTNGFAYPELVRWAPKCKKQPTAVAPSVSLRMRTAENADVQDMITVSPAPEPSHGAGCEARLRIHPLSDQTTASETA